MAAHEDAVLPWQLACWNGLRARMDSGRLHHALLLAGPQGIGKRALAGHIARALLCAEAADRPCGHCRSCQLERAGSHPDSLRVSPEEPGRQIRIAQVREELIDFVMRTPSIAARKVVLVEPAEAMNTATANCLLKSLEEPAPGTHLLLVCDAPVRLLPTVRSRCERVPLAPPAREEALQWLSARCDGADAPDLLGAASGSPLRALQLAQSGGLEPFERVAGVMLRALDPGAWVPTLAAALDAMELREALAWMQIVLADLLRFMADPAALRIARARRLYESMRATVDPAHVARTARRVDAAAREAASTANPNRLFTLESLLVDWGRRAGRAP